MPDHHPMATPAEHPDLRQALVVLSQGGVVAFPTETYYGLAVDPFNPQAVERLFRLKQRPASKPVLLLIDQTERLALLATAIPAPYPPLMARFWPGPLTLIFPACSDLPPALTAGTGTVGVRISSLPLARQLTTLAGGAITATSANRSGLAPAASEQEVVAQFGRQLDWLLAAGTTHGGPASTVVAAGTDGLRLVRAGAVSVVEVMAASAGAPSGTLPA